MGTPVSFELYGILLFSVFQLYEFNILDGYKFPVYLTDFCPKSQLHWNERSSAINCTEDNGYLCLPNENITELVEFCLPYPFTLMQEDQCYYLSKRSSIVNSIGCRHFIKGCPSSSFPSFKMFYYPSCTSIRNGCFRDAPDCKSSTTNPPDYSWHNKLENLTFTGKENSTTTSIQETTKHIQREPHTKNKIDWVLIASLSGAFIFICVAICSLNICFKKKKYLNCKRNKDIECCERKPLPKNEYLNCKRKSKNKNEEEIPLTTKVGTSTEKKGDIEDKSEVGTSTEKKVNTEDKPEDDIINQVNWHLKIPTLPLFNEEDKLTEKDDGHSPYGMEDSLKNESKSNIEREEEIQMSYKDIPDFAMSQHYVDCQTCGKYSDFYCNSCHKRMCFACRDEHISNIDNTKHEVCRYKDRKLRFMAVLCKFHPEQSLILCCIECSQAICGLCTTKLHFGHSFSDLEKVYTDRRNEYLGEIRKIRDVILPHCQSRLDTIRKAKRNLESNIDERAGQIKNLEIEEKDYSVKVNDLQTHMSILQMSLQLISSGNPVYYLPKMN